MNYIRIIIFGLVTLLASWQTHNDFMLAFPGDSLPDIMEIPGILNVWTSLTGIFIGIFALIATINLMTINSSKLQQHAMKIFFLGLFICLVPAFVIKQHMSSNIHSYIECNDLQKLKSRYSSRTYTSTSDLCQELIYKKQHNKK